MPAARFTKAEITRAVEATKACDLVVSGIEIGPDGTIRVLCPAETKPAKPDTRAPKDW